MTRVVTYVEIDVPFCKLSYGILPCKASGSVKCFNSFGTCQSRETFDQEFRTIRFTESHNNNLLINALPCLSNTDVQTAKISLGNDLGLRSSVNISLVDFKYSDTNNFGDPYLSERGWDAYDRGTFFARLKARHPYLRGRPLRVYRGVKGQSLDQMLVRYYLVEDLIGPDQSGNVMITGQDALKFADGDRAQAPKPSTGFLTTELDLTTTTFNVGPAGVGDLDYPTSGYINVGGSEIMKFTRSGDTFTVNRGWYDTAPDTHKTQDRVQLCLEFFGTSPAYIIRDLLRDYANTPESVIPIDQWTTEVNSFLRRQYTRLIAEPTSVRQLISEMIEQAALALWYSDTDNLIKLQVLKQIPVDAGVLDEDVYSQNSVKISDQPSKRISTCQVLYGLKNPLLDETRAENYRGMVVVSDIQGQSDFGTPAIDIVYGTWIPSFAKSTATRLGALRVGRYVKAPRKITLDVHKAAPLLPNLGEGYFFHNWSIQDETGKQVRIPIQVTNVSDKDDKYSIEAEEATFISQEEDDLTNRTIHIDSNSFNVNWRRLYDQIFPPPQPEDDIRCYISAGVLVGSRDPNFAAFETGDWPDNVTIKLYVQGEIRGAGGLGGWGQSAGFLRRTVHPAQKGGVALYTRKAVIVSNTGKIWGGGGGGGPAPNGLTSGGGGAGYIAGSVIQSDLTGDQNHFGPASPGSLNSGGNGAWFRGQKQSATSYGGRGGDPGSQGGDGYNNFSGNRVAGGAAGPAIDGVSRITWDGWSGDIWGPQIN